MIVNFYVSDSEVGRKICNTDSRIRVSKYTNYQQLLFSELIPLRNNVFVIDLDFKDITSPVNAAKQLRQKYKDCQIIFIGSLANYDPAIYTVKHKFFIPKESIDECLETAIKIAADSFNSRVIFINSYNTLVKINIENIHYIERKGIERRTHFYLNNGEVVSCDAKLVDIENYLPEGTFIRCHNSFSVPIDKIAKLSRSTVKLASGHECPVSRSHYEELKNCLENSTLELLD